MRLRRFSCAVSSSSYNTWKVNEVYFSTMGCDYSGAGRVARDAGGVVSSLSVNPNLARDEIEAEQQIAFDGSYSQPALITSDPAQLDDDGQQIFFVGQAFSSPMAIDCATIVTPSCSGSSARSFCLDKWTGTEWAEQACADDPAYSCRNQRRQ